MAKKLLFIILAGLLPQLVMADGNEALFEAANANYAEGKYVEAIDAYQQILVTGQESAEIFYNLGNAYFKNNQLTLAILNFERGLVLEPGDEDIKYNLSIANELISDKIDDLPQFFLKTWFHSVRNIFSSNNWALISLISFIAFCALLTIFFITRRRRLKSILLAGMILGLFLTVAGLSLSVHQSRKVSDRNTGIVFAPSITIKSSPDESGNDLFILHEGVKLQITDRIAGWYEIKLADGNKGWIPIEAVEII